ncbi:hypothetical protein KKC97_01475 [bacterium]|nr:hypothetical protein [bacterium]MBU1636321.1 hypothetical protein [bacterium]MBU1920019.1 hypothetical protein [bacterium]
MWQEYDYASKLEQELCRNRWVFFTAMLTVSLAVCGIALNQMDSATPLFGKIAISFGWLIFAAAYYHYWWFHKITHRLRDHLCVLEKELKITVYIIRCDRTIHGCSALRYHWVIDILALAYTMVLVFILFR